MKELKRIKNAYSILAITLTIFGIILLLKPITALNFMFKICGIISILFGIVKIMGYFSKDIFQLAFQFDLILGIISCVIGCVSLFKTGLSIEILGAIVGIFVLADALSKVQTAIDAKKFGLESWHLLMTAAVIASAIGILLLLFPLKGSGLIIRLLGLNLAIDGILNLLIVQSTVKTMHSNKEWKI